MCFRRLNDRDVQRPWSAAAQARRDRDTGSAPANNQDLMMLSVSHGPRLHQLSVDASLRLSGSTFNSAIRPKRLLASVFGKGSMKGEAFRESFFSARSAHWPKDGVIGRWLVDS